MREPSEGHRTGRNPFAELGLIEPLLKAVARAGYDRPTPIQAQAIPPALDGRDVLGCAQTGTGKTAAFVLPILQRLVERQRQRTERTPFIRVLVLSPTRELTAQIARSFDEYGQFTRLRQITIFGGVGQSAQVSELRRGADILVATPGRLVDLIDQGHIDLSHVDTFVLDEVDRMLDQGFLPAVRRVLRFVPEQRQTLFFSATMPKELAPLAERILTDPVRVSVAPVASTPDRVDQAVHFVEQTDKRRLLERLLHGPEITRAVVFTRTKHGANRVARHLLDAGVRADAIHGNKSQNARERALSGFRDGALRVLVATDLAARGIDIDGISHVINFDLPMDPESYVHRIGRTARAGESGSAISFCSAEERPLLQRIERVIRRRVPVIGEEPRRSAEIAHHAPRASDHRPPRGAGRPARGGGRGH